MKKLLLLLLFIPLTFACSDDEEIIDNIPENIQLCTSVLYEYFDGNLAGYSAPINYTYSDSKIISETGVGWIVSSSPNGTTVETYNVFSENTFSNELLTTKDVTKELPDGSPDPESYVENFEYNDNGFLIKKTITWYYEGQSTDVYDIFYTWSNNNLTRQETTSNEFIIEINYDSNYNILERKLINPNTTEALWTITNTYDYSKNYAFTNSIGYNYDSYSVKNPTLTSYSSSSNRTYYYEYTYDENDYILTLSKTSSSDDNYLRTRTYTYN